MNSDQLSTENGSPRQFRSQATAIALFCVALVASGCGSSESPQPVDPTDMGVRLPDSRMQTSQPMPSAPEPPPSAEASTPPAFAKKGVEQQVIEPPALPKGSQANVNLSPILAADKVSDPAPTEDGGLEKTADNSPQLTPAGQSEPTDAEGGAEPESYQSWPAPQVALVVTGNQYGYIEPCGCTGLENQKGGLARRMTFFSQLSALDWKLVPVDAGNQVRRFGRQSEVKFQATANGLQQMGYQAVGFGPNDLSLGVGELVAVAAADDPQKGLFVSANVTLIDPSLTAKYKVIESGGRRIGVTSVLDPSAVENTGGEIEVTEPESAVAESLRGMASGQADFRVLMFYGEEKKGIEIVTKTPGFDLLVIAGGYGEPTYRPQEIVGSKTRWIVTGNKGMYAGIVGIYPDQPFRYARVAMTHDFEDAPAMRQLMANYQDQLKALGLSGLGLRPIAHPAGDRFVGSKICGECHTTAYAIWEGTPHFRATDDIVKPGERGDVPRHFDPECISCHVTGWNPQNYYPYESGYLSLEDSSHLKGNGCENCHGPGEKHSQAERENSGVEEAQRDLLRVAMRLPLEKAKDRCLECHDLDNSPDFHKDGAFEDYWAEVAHEGLD